MTRQKSFKQRVRARMDKTGESYSAARSHLVGRADDTPPPGGGPSSGSLSPGAVGTTGPGSGTSTPVSTAPAPKSAPAKAAPTAAMNARIPDRSVREHTGRDYAEWFTLLDGWDAVSHTHTEIATWLVEERDVPEWWAQTVTVAYEQARGLRIPGQKKDGFAVSASKTVNAPVERLFAAFVEEAERERWLSGSDLSVRTATEPKRLTADFDHGTRLTVGFTVKGETKSTVAFEHTKLADAETAARTKEFWRHRLGRLKVMLEKHG